MRKKLEYKLDLLGQETEQELHRDNIAHIYLDKEGDTETHRRARDRINYLVDEIDIGTVLDIGCSEGIMAIKASQKGCHVRGIDIHPDAISYARHLAHEMLNESDKIPEFIVSDIFSLEHIPAEFDTVVLGEVIEHVFEPQNMLKRACLALKLGGKMIITTPWGYMPAPDHHQTFFLTNFLEIIPDPISVDSLEVKDDYIRFVGTKQYDPTVGRGEEKSAKSQYLEQADLLELTEKAALESQFFLREVLDNKQERLNASWSAANRIVSCNDTLDQKIKDLQKANKIAGYKIQKLQENNKKLIEDNRNLKNKSVLQQVKNAVKIIIEKKT